MKRIYFSLLVIFLFTGCSLKYDENSAVSQDAPELIFSNPVVSRFENGVLNARLSAQEFERYKKNAVVYAHNVEFESYDMNNQIETSGKCGYLSMNQDAGQYLLFDSIQLFSRNYDASFYANYLKWNDESQQLTGSLRDTVRIEKSDGIIFGTGFSASALSGSFKFNGTVTGEMESE